MLDVCLLGTGGMMPLPRRWLTALMCRYNGSNILIDCGEGTQVAIKQKGWSFKTYRCYLHNTFSRRSYKWTAGIAADYGKCRKNRTINYDRTKRS